MTARDVRTALRDAAASSTLVRLWRRGLDRRPFDTFVLAVTDQLALLQPVRDRLDLDGYDVIRAGDVTKVVPSPMEAFLRRALRVNGQRPRRPKGVDLASMQSAMISVSRAFPPLVITREAVARGACEVGCITEIDRTRYRLRWMTPTAEFESDERVFRVADVTLLQFGGGYERTLGRVAGLDRR